MLMRIIAAVRHERRGQLFFNFFVRLFLVALVLTGGVAWVSGQSVHLQWDANPEADLAGYRVYRSTTGVGFSPLTQNLVGAPDYTDVDPALGTTNYYVVTAVNNSGLESGFSNQLAVFVEAPPAPNGAPLANAGADQQKREGRQVTLLGSGSDPDNDTLSYHWSQVGGPAVNLGNPGVATPSFMAPAVTADTVLTFQLLVEDGRGGSGTDTTNVTVVNNHPPQVQTGTNQTVDFGQTVQLSGSATDADGDPITYSWVQTAGAPVALSGANTPTATFSAPSNEDTLIFRLVASDDELSGSASTQVVVANLNQSPVANAGTDTSIRERGQGTLNGSGTDPNGDALTYQWTQMSGPVIALENPGQAQTGFVAPSVDSDSLIVLRLMVEDTRGAQDSDEVQITVRANRPPTVEAGPDRSADFDETLTLPATAHDPDNDALTYRWVQSSGPAVTLVGGDTLSPSFTAPSTDGTLVFQVTASDDEFAVSDSISVTVADINRDPVADAGPDQTTKENRPVSLSGAGSDPEGDPVTFRWSQVAGPTVALDDASSANAKFKAPRVDRDTTMVFQLLVSDGNGGEARDETRVTVTDNRPPGVSTATVQNVGFEENVTLKGSATDPDGDPLKYSWVQTGGTPVELTGADTLKATFVAPAEEATLTFEFTAQDEEFTSNAMVPVQVLPRNRDPRVQLGADIKVRERLIAKLLATASDPDGDPIAYEWKQTAGPLVALSNSRQARISFTAPETDKDLQLAFEVTVTDGVGGKATDNILVTVTNNLPPTVDAGFDETAVIGHSVRLAGKAEDPNEDQLHYGWVQLSGPKVALNQPYHDTVTFTAPDVEGTLVFRFTANDDEFRVDDTVRLEIVSDPPLSVPATLADGGPEFENLFVGLALANLHDKPTGVTLSGLDAEGFEQGRRQLDMLPALGQDAFLTVQLPELADLSKSLLATGSESPLQGFFMVGDWSGASLDGVGGKLVQSSQLTFPIAKRSDSDNTLIYLFNPGTDSNEVTVKLHSPDGGDVADKTLTLAPNGSLTATVDQLFGPVKPDDGYIDAVGTSALRGFELYRREGGLLSAAGAAFKPVTRLSAPHFFAAGEGNGSELRLLSGSTRNAQVTIEAFNDNGERIGSYQGELAPHAMLVRDVGSLLQLDGSAGAQSGYLEIRVRSIPFQDPVRVSGLITFQANQGEAMASLPLVDEGRTDTKFLQVAQSNADGVFTGLTVLNPGKTDANVVLEAFDEHGAPTGRAEFTLPPGHRLAGLLGDDVYFGQGFQQVKGHLRLRSSQPVTAFALFGDYGLNYLAALEGQ